MNPIPPSYPIRLAKRQHDEVRATEPYKLHELSLSGILAGNRWRWRRNSAADQSRGGLGRAPFMSAGFGTVNSPSLIVTNTSAVPTGGDGIGISQADRSIPYRCPSCVLK